MTNLLRLSHLGITVSFVRLVMSCSLLAFVACSEGAGTPRDHSKYPPAEDAGGGEPNPVDSGSGDAGQESVDAAEDIADAAQDGGATDTP